MSRAAGFRARQHVALGTDMRMSFQGYPLLSRDKTELIEMASAMADLLAPERVNSFLRDPNNHPHYPTLHGYKEEIRWFFHGLGRLV
ncbi:MAG: hypothetical protein ACRDBP_16290 [Luteolibacter sp.]